MSEAPVLLVTGGSRGIGASVCRLAGAAGWQVAVNYVSNLAAAEAVVADIQDAGGSAIPVQGDVGSELGLGILGGGELKRQLLRLRFDTRQILADRCELGFGFRLESVLGGADTVQLLLRLRPAGALGLKLLAL